MEGSEPLLFLSAFLLVCWLSLRTWHLLCHETWHPPATLPSIHGPRLGNKIQLWRIQLLVAQAPGLEDCFIKLLFQCCFIYIYINIQYIIVCIQFKHIYVRRYIHFTPPSSRHLLLRTNPFRASGTDPSNSLEAIFRALKRICTHRYPQRLVSLL